MSPTRFDTGIVGQGLAGTTLAWALRRRGQRVVVVDRNEPATASRVAAGLITPVTGLRFVKSWRFDEFLPEAVAFYPFVERQTHLGFFESAPAIRLFTDAGERERFQQRAAHEDSETAALPLDAIDATRFDATHGGFAMPRAARLDVPRYIAASRDIFLRDGCFLEADLHPADDLHFKSNAVHLPRLDVRCDRLIFCEGFAAATNPWFDAIPFDAAKGEVLTVRIAGLNERRVLHRGVSLVPLGDDLYKVGATYDRDHLDGDCTTAGRAELCERLRQLLRLPFEVVAHEAAVRPILLGKRPAVGFHPAAPQLGYFNGLGSKGALQAPWFAAHFAAIITGEKCSAKFISHEPM